jgi:hypothetical protein
MGKSASAHKIFKNLSLETFINKIINKNTHKAKIDRHTQQTDR